MSIKKIHNVHELEHLNLNDRFVIVNDTTVSEFIKGVEYKVTGLTANRGVVTVNTETAKFTYKSQRVLDSEVLKVVRRYKPDVIDTSNSSSWIKPNTSDDTGKL